LSDEPAVSLELAVVMRQDTTQAAMLEEIRAMHTQHARISARSREFEERR
jgi:hypothetical protein